MEAFDVIDHIAIDTHTHSVLSGHAYCTLNELCLEAVSIGMQRFVLSEHGPLMPRGTPFFLPMTNAGFPNTFHGVRVYYGLECDIADYNGGFGADVERFQHYLEFGTASLHSVVLKSGTVEQNTSALIGALKNKYIDIIGHPGNTSFPVDIEKVVLTAKAYNKLIEINNHSFVHRAGCEANCLEFARLCKKYGVRVAVASDAHISGMIGRVPAALEKLNSIDFPAELVVNSTLERFDEYLKERKARVGK
jgi:putative hydrolase